jgi:hypothetical protein
MSLADGAFKRYPAVASGENDRTEDIRKILGSYSVAESLLKADESVEDDLASVL